MDPAAARPLEGLLAAGAHATAPADALERLRELVALHDWIRSAPVKLRRELKGGPRDEPACGVCTAIAAVDG
jgi:hypothetical protein